jgi:hypothetical protein
MPRDVTILGGSIVCVCVCHCDGVIDGAILKLRLIVYSKNEQKYGKEATVAGVGTSSSYYTRLLLVECGG